MTTKPVLRLPQPMAAYLFGVLSGFMVCLVLLWGLLEFHARATVDTPMYYEVQALSEWVTGPGPRIESFDFEAYKARARECAAPLKDALKTCEELNDLFYRRITGESGFEHVLPLGTAVPIGMDE